MEGEHASLRPAGDGAGEVEPGAGVRAFRPGSRPASEAYTLRFQAVCLGDDPVEVGLGEGGVVFFPVARLVLGQVGELAHQPDQPGLDAIDKLDPAGVVGGGAGQP